MIKKKFIRLYLPQGPLHVAEGFDSAANKQAYRFPAYVYDCLLWVECGHRVVDRLEINIKSEKWTFQWRSHHSSSVKTGQTS